MLKEVFLPNFIDSYYLLTQKLVACQITKTHIKVSLVKAVGKKRIVERIVEKRIELDLALLEDEQVEYLSKAIDDVFAKIGKFNSLIFVLPSSVVFFKDMRLPFKSSEKIKMVLPFEIESSLPFPLNEAFVDCIIEPGEGEFSNVFAAAVKKSQVLNSVAPFEKIKLVPDRFSVEAFELFSLYKFVEKSDKSNLILLYIGAHSICVQTVVKGELKAVRSIPKGIFELYNFAEGSFDKRLKGALEGDDGLGDFKGFFADVKLFMDANKTKLSEGEAFGKILLMGPGVEVKSLNKLVSKIFGVSCENFGVNDVLKEGTVSFETKTSLVNDAITTVAAALSLKGTRDFNLNRPYVEEKEQKIIFSQLVAAGILMLVILGLFFINGSLQVGRFKREIDASSKEIVRTFKKEFPKLPKNVSGVSKIIKVAQKFERDEANVWFAMSPRRRFLFLSYLQDLGVATDPQGLGLDLSRLVILSDSAGNEMLLEGEVSDYDSLRMLRNVLEETALFKAVPKLSELKFSIRLDLKDKYGEV